MEWRIANDEKTWELREDTRVLGTLRWDKNAGQFGAYVDGNGLKLSRRFDEAREKVVARAKGAGA
jgi:hypothetical protein